MSSASRVRISAIVKNEHPSFNLTIKIFNKNVATDKTPIKIVLTGLERIDLVLLTRIVWNILVYPTIILFVA